MKSNLEALASEDSEKGTLRVVEHNGSLFCLRKDAHLILDVSEEVVHYNWKRLEEIKGAELRDQGKFIDLIVSSIKDVTTAVQIDTLYETLFDSAIVESEEVTKAAAQRGFRDRNSRVNLIHWPRYSFAVLDGTDIDQVLRGGMINGEEYLSFNSVRQLGGIGSEQAMRLLEKRLTINPGLIERNLQIAKVRGRRTRYIRKEAIPEFFSESYVTIIEKALNTKTLIYVPEFDLRVASREEAEQEINLRNLLEKKEFGIGSMVKGVFVDNERYASCSSLSLCLGRSRTLINQRLSNPENADLLELLESTGSVVEVENKGNSRSFLVHWERMQYVLSSDELLLFMEKTEQGMEFIATARNYNFLEEVSSLAPLPANFVKSFHITDLKRPLHAYEHEGYKYFTLNEAAKILGVKRISLSTSITKLDPKERDRFFANGTLASLIAAHSISQKSLAVREDRMWELFYGSHFSPRGRAANNAKRAKGNFLRREKRFNFIAMPKDAYSFFAQAPPERILRGFTVGKHRYLAAPTISKISGINTSTIEYRLSHSLEAQPDLIDLGQVAHLEFASNPVLCIREDRISELVLQGADFQPDRNEIVYVPEFRSTNLSQEATVVEFKENKYVNLDFLLETYNVDISQLNEEGFFQENKRSDLFLEDRRYIRVQDIWRLFSPVFESIFKALQIRHGQLDDALQNRKKIKVFSIDRQSYKPELKIKIYTDKDKTYLQPQSLGISSGEMPKSELVYVLDKVAKEFVVAVREETLEAKLGSQALEELLQSDRTAVQQREAMSFSECKVSIESESQYTITEILAMFGLETNLSNRRALEAYFERHPRKRHFKDDQIIGAELPSFFPVAVAKEFRIKTNPKALLYYGKEFIRLDVIAQVYEVALPLLESQVENHEGNQKHNRRVIQHSDKKYVRTDTIIRLIGEDFYFSRREFGERRGKMNYYPVPDQIVKRKGLKVFKVNN
jgi:hypothetical protein